MVMALSESDELTFFSKSLKSMRKPTDFLNS